MNKITEATKLLEQYERDAEARAAIEAPGKVEKKPLLSGENWSREFTILGGSNAVTKAYAEAFNILLDLRRQPGCEAAEGGKGQWGIGTKGDVGETYSLELKLSDLCPWFDSEDSALAAREAVGWDRIMRMYNTLHGRGYE